MRDAWGGEGVRRVVFVLASGVTFVLALGVAFLDWHGSLAQAAQPGKCPPGSTYEKVTGFHAVCANKVDGTPGKDVLVGSKNTRITDKMYGRGGNDRLYGYAGDDGISGGGGQDTIRGGQGNDGLFGDPGRDKIYGGPGRETIYATEGGDTVYAGPGNDGVYAQDGKRDIIFCGSGRDFADVDILRDDIKNCESRQPPCGPGEACGLSFWELFM
jgi:Ca2+-binding RTX toxin-like protein